MNLEQSFQCCSYIAKTQDEDRYLGSMLAPVPARQHLQTLIAFNVEIAKIHRVVSEPMLGEIRLQWWREVLDQIYGGQAVRRHEVSVALQETITACALPRDPFEKALNAHGIDFYEQPVEDLPSLVKYFEDTEGTLLTLMLQTLGHQNISPDPIESLGIAWGFARFGRAITQEDPFSQKFLGQHVTGDTEASTFANAQAAHYLNQAKGHLPIFPAGAAPVLVHFALCRGYASGRQISAFRRRAIMLWANLRGRL